MNFFQAWFLTITVETIVLLLLLGKKHDWGVIARNSVLASTATLPFVWFIFPTLPLSWTIQITLSESFAILAETAIYASLFRRMDVREAFVASLLCNAASFTIGILLDSVSYSLGTGFWL